MNVREFLVLEAVNLATTRFRRKGHDFEATAAQITEVIRTDERFDEDYGNWLRDMTVQQVGNHLSRLAKRRYGPALVTKIDSRRWRLTDAGVGVLSA